MARPIRRVMLDDFAPGAEPAAKAAPRRVDDEDVCEAIEVGRLTRAHSFNGEALTLTIDLPRLYDEPTCPEHVAANVGHKARILAAIEGMNGLEILIGSETPSQSVGRLDPGLVSAIARRENNHLAERTRDRTAAAMLGFRALGGVLPGD
jgi:hypothetical protein